jgi:hypothetical protein
MVKAITRRHKPIFHDIIPGYSAEHLLLGRSATEARVHMRLKEMVPNLVALNFPKSGTHYLSIKKTAEGQARHALMLLLGLDPYLKFVVAVDGDVNVFDEEEVLWALATRFRPIPICSWCRMRSAIGSIPRRATGCRPNSRLTRRRPSNETWSAVVPREAAAKRVAVRRLGRDC